MNRREHCIQRIGVELETDEESSGLQTRRIVTRDPGRNLTPFTYVRNLTHQNDDCVRLVEYRGTSRDEQPEIYLLIGSASCKKATTFPAWTTARPLRVAAMARTKKARADNPKHDTADSRRQLKRTKLELPSRSKQDRPKKSGRVSFDYETDPPQERPPLKLDAADVVVARVEGEASDDAKEGEAFSVRATARGSVSPHATPPRAHASPVSPAPAVSAPAPASPSPRVPRSAASVALRSATAIASATATATPEFATPTVVNKLLGSPR